MSVEERSEALEEWQRVLSERAIQRFGYHQFVPHMQNSNGVMKATSNCLRCGYDTDHPIHRRRR